MTRRNGQLALANVRGVDVAHWDPLRRTTTWGQPTHRARAVRNFGDLLGPLIVRELVRELGLRPRAGATPRLLTIGSILHFAQPGDVIWGSGINTKAGTEFGGMGGLDFRAVRGPRSFAILAQLGLSPARGLGDPGLLLGALRPDLVVAPEQRRGVAIVPNLNELAALDSRDRVVNPRWPLRRVVDRIAASELVVGSSLHGIIVAEALGVPARAVHTGAEGAFKYEDYYLATGREPHGIFAATAAEAIQRGGVEPPDWDPRRLLAAFPDDLWAGSAEPHRLEQLASRLHAGRTVEGEGSWHSTVRVD